MANWDVLRKEVLIGIGTLKRYMSLYSSPLQRRLEV
jgi:hypothetical protein